MGRRKIEIRAIKDDRNRSVTFLKRKGGLFKKAHELSVLCSVDVAVIIFGHNKKLYEFSSGDINETLRRYNYYGQPHEHKGPNDFKGKGGDDDDDDDDDDEPINTREDSLPPPPQQQHAGIPPHLQHHNSFSHVRPPHQASASPPMPNGVFQRHATPQPQQMDSRPTSRNTVRRTSSNLVPLQHPQHTPTPPQNGYAYVQNPPIYNQQSNPTIRTQPPQPHFQPFTSQPQPPPPQQQQPPQQQSQTQQQSAQQVQAHQQYIQEHQRRQSQPQAARYDNLQPPQQTVTRASPQPEAQTSRPSEPTPPQPRHLSSKSKSIFTPIDEGGSVLAQHFFGAPDPPRSQMRSEPAPDLKPPPRNITSQPEPHQSNSQPTRPQSVSSEFPPPSRTNTSGSRSGARPKLNLQIPSEASDGESAVEGSPQPRSAGPSANPARAGGGGDHIVLPPPSPSASAVLSAGASGPPNPFARPPPPTSSQNRDAYQENRNNNIETPISALPSRYMNNDLLPSPSNFFSEWGAEFGRNGGLNSAVLPSPLAFPTPADARGPSFARGDAQNESNSNSNSNNNNSSNTSGGDNKRRNSLEREGDAKKVKT